MEDTNIVLLYSLHFSITNYNIIFSRNDFVERKKIEFIAWKVFINFAKNGYYDVCLK